MMLGPLGEVGANFSLQLASRTQSTKINNKKVIAENQCEKHKKSSLVGKCLLFDKSQNKIIHTGHRSQANKADSYM